MVHCWWRRSSNEQLAVTSVVENHIQEGHRAICASQYIYLRERERQSTGCSSKVEEHSCGSTNSCIGKKGPYAFYFTSNIPEKHLTEKKNYR